MIFRFFKFKINTEGTLLRGANADKSDKIFLHETVNCCLL